MTMISLIGNIHFGQNFKMTMVSINGIKKCKFGAGKSHRMQFWKVSKMQWRCLMIFASSWNLKVRDHQIIIQSSTVWKPDSGWCVDPCWKTFYIQSKTWDYSRRKCSKIFSFFHSMILINYGLNQFQAIISNHIPSIRMEYILF